MSLRNLERYLRQMGQSIERHRKELANANRRFAADILRRHPYADQLVQEFPKMAPLLKKVVK